MVFDSVAEVVASTSLSVGMTISTLGYYTRGDGGGNDYEIVTAATGTVDGGSYINLATHQAKGLFTGYAINVKQFGATGDGATDDSTPIQSAINYVEGLSGTSSPTVVSEANITVTLSGDLYAIASGLTITKNINFTGGSLVALSGFTGTFMLTISAGAERAVISDIDFDGGLEELVAGTPSTWSRYADIISCSAYRVVIKDVLGIHFPNYGLRMIETQECSVTNVLMREWAFSEQGTTYGTLRTAKAFSVEGADGKFVSCVGAQSLYTLYVSGALNMFTSCHFYNGASTDTTEDVNVFLDNTENTMLTGCYFDNGSLYIKDSFNHNITGGHFQRTGTATNTSGIKTDTAAVTDLVSGLSVVGCTFNGTYTNGEIQFSGTGSYSDDLFKQINWIGNIRSDGNPAWYEAKFSGASFIDLGSSTHQASGTSFDIKSNKALRISADYDANSAPTDSTIILSTDAVDRWTVESSGAFLPFADNTYVIGDSTHRAFNVFSNRYTIMDGVGAPATVAGHATIYIDSVDGDLKIKFGDGVIKTIAVDT
tara:strand:- start:23841 stop:25463 length:1623 start_codon:yes stop_codon:yes gene_type:complete